MTTFRILSDLHLEFHGHQTKGSEHLVLAGDIGVGANHREWMQRACDQHESVSYVSGNHEFYGSSVPAVEDFWERSYQHPSFRYLNRKSSVVANIRLAGATLWTALGTPKINARIKEGMNDFYRIQEFNLDVWLDLHRQDVAFLKTQVGADIIITHHAPSFLSIDPMYAGSPINPAFASNLDWLVEELQPKYWIHGHTHKAKRYKIGETTVLCNPRGYPGEHTGFDSGLTIEL